MNPNMEQNPSQDSTSAHDPPSEDTSHQSKKRERKEEDPTPKSDQEQFDVKEEPGEDFPPIRSSDPMHANYYEDASAGLSEAPWNWAMNELRCIQHDVEILRSRIDGVEALRDMREWREGHETLSTRVSSVEECTNVHHVRKFMRRKQANNTIQGLSLQEALNTTPNPRPEALHTI